MKVNVIEMLNPFQTERKEYTLEHCSSVMCVLLAKNPDFVEFNYPTICLLNGAPLLRRDWHKHILNHNDVVCFIAQAQGPLAAIPFAVYLGLIATGVLVVGAIAAGIMLKPPELGKTPAPDPVYGLNGQNNQVRLNNPIEVAYGRNKLWPSYASRPFTRYQGNDQYLYQLLCLGQGEFDIEGIFIEDTPISSFDIEYAVYGPNEKPTLFSANVSSSIEVNNIELTGGTAGAQFEISAISKANPCVVTTERTHPFIVGDSLTFVNVAGMTNLNGNFYTVTGVTSTTITLALDSTSFNNFVTFVGRESKLRKKGRITKEFYEYAGPFVANAAGTLATRLEVDLIYPEGIYYQDSKGGTWSFNAPVLFEFQEIDDDGNPVGVWDDLVYYNQESYSLRPLRLTFYADVTPARYRMRARRTSPDSADPKDHDLTMWGAMRAVLQSDMDYGDVTILAIKAKATNNLNSNSSNRVGVIATRKLPIYNAISETWSSRTATRNPIWAFCDAVRSSYGGNLGDNYLDLDYLAQVADDLTTEGINFDWVFEQKISLWDALTTIARVTYGSPTMYGAIFSITRDVIKALPVGLFNQENIIKNSLSWQVKLFDIDEYDSIEIEYIDAATWKTETVLCYIDGDAINPEKVTVAGITNRDKAYQYGLYLAAAKRYRREIIKFETGREGLIPTYGDLISISHDVPRWGSGGYIVAIDGLDLETSQPCVFESGNHYIILRKKNGQATEPLLVTSVSEYHLLLDEPLADDFYFDDYNEPPFYHFGKADEWAKLAIVTATNPQGKNVEIQAIPYDLRVYEGNEDAAPALGDDPFIADPALPDVIGLTVSVLPSLTPQILVSWNASAGAKSYLLERKSGESLNWEIVTVTSGVDFVMTIDPIYLYLRLSAFNLGQGAYDYWEGYAGYAAGIPFDVNDLRLISDFVGRSFSVDWDSVANADYYALEVWADGALSRSVTMANTNYNYSIDDAIADGDIFREMKVRVVAVNEDGESTTYAELDVSNPIPAVPADFAFSYLTETATHIYYAFAWSANLESDIDSYRIYGDDTTGFTPSDSNKLAEVNNLTGTVQLIKTPKTKTITNITNAMNAVVTTSDSAHAIEAGDFITITGVVGMTEVNSNTYEVLSVTTHTLTIDVNSLLFGAYTSSGSLTTANNYASTYYFVLSAKDVWGDDINPSAEIEVTP